MLKKIPTFFYIPRREREEKEIFNEQASLILPENKDEGELYLGSVQAAKNISFLKSNNIKSVLSVGGDHHIFYDKNEIRIKHKILGSLGATKEEHQHAFLDSIQFISKQRKEGAVLVHCGKGVQRSPVIIIAYIMYTQQISYEDAHSFVLNKRKVRPLQFFDSNYWNFLKIENK